MAQPKQIETMNELEKITECKKYLAYIKQKYGTTNVNTIKNLIK